MIIFTKTGSGQTSEKLKKEYRFSYRLPVQWQASLPKEALPRRRLEDAFRALSAGRPHALGDRAAGARLGLREPRLYQLAQGLLPPFGAQNCPLLRLAVFLSRTKEKPIVCQDRLGTNIRKLNKNGPFSRTTTQPDQSECSSRWLENRGKEKKKAVLEVRKRRFCPTTFRISKTISLPRQARDKNHRENDSKKSTTVRLFIQCYACRPPSP